MHLLVPLALASWSYFLEIFILDLTIGLAISRVELIGKKIAISLSR